MMCIRHMWVAVPGRDVRVVVAVSSFVRACMKVLMMTIVVPVRMLVFDGVMQMFMLVRFREVKHYAHEHQRAACEHQNRR